MSRRALVIALIVSVAVNLFAVGAVVGTFLLGPRIHEGREAHFRGPPFWNAAAELPPARRQAYHRALLDEAEEVRATLRAARRARREAWMSLGEPGFEPQAAAGRLERARVLEMQARNAIERRILDFAATLPPAERATFAEGLARSRPGRRGGGPPP